MLPFPIPPHTILSYPIHLISSLPTPSYPILSCSNQNYPVPSYPFPSHPIPSYPISSHPIPSHPIPSLPIQSHPFPSYPIHPASACYINYQFKQLMHAGTLSWLVEAAPPSVTIRAQWGAPLLPINQPDRWISWRLTGPAAVPRTSFFFPYFLIGNVSHAEAPAD